MKVTSTSVLEHLRQVDQDTNQSRHYTDPPRRTSLWTSRRTGFNYLGIILSRFDVASNSFYYFHKVNSDTGLLCLSPLM
ncbi:hypothetical protein RRG08_037827 [Elysia crispata]|uniref:Uncharacterized protein n=1 Tax=Elysia crispata TaxID=231223 RepID=A0AAE1D4W7_9GAST|nr:hypothetical protein RRG08_037827 [Elysia crispata]